MREQTASGSVCPECNGSRWKMVWVEGMTPFIAGPATIGRWKSVPCRSCNPSGRLRLSGGATERNAIERAIDSVARTFGEAGMAAVISFLASLPYDAVIEWCEDDVCRSLAGLVALQVQDELQREAPRSSAL